MFRIQPNYLIMPNFLMTPTFQFPSKKKLDGFQFVHTFAYFLRFSSQSWHTHYLYLFIP
jgi:hypothetical protein